MLTIILLILAAVCFGLRLLGTADGRVTAAGGLLLCLAIALSGGVPL